MTNSDYQRLNQIDSVLATRELHQLVETDLVEQHGTRGGAYYTLAALAQVEKPLPTKSPEQQVLAYVREHGFITRAECAAELRVTPRQASYLLRKMRDQGLLQMEGRRKGARYVLP